MVTEGPLKARNLHSLLQKCILKFRDSISIERIIMVTEPAKFTIYLRAIRLRVARRRTKTLQEMDNYFQNPLVVEKSPINGSLELQQVG